MITNECRSYRLIFYIFVAQLRACFSQAPPFLLQTVPVPQIPFYYPPVENVFDCTGVNQTATYQPWPSHFITPTLERLTFFAADNAKQSISFGNSNLYQIPATPIECTSQTQLRNGSCTSYYACVHDLGGTINVSPHCPVQTFCCMLPTCALIIGSKTRHGHCRPKRTCPGIFDTVAGVSVGCPDADNAPCCVAEEVNITCPRNYDLFATALVKTYGLLNTTEIASPQRVLAWAPFLLTAFDEAIGSCVLDCHKTAFFQYFMNQLSEMFMFNSGMNGFYKQLADWKGISQGLLPATYFSYYSPYTFSHFVRALFDNFQLEQLYGARSLLSMYRIFDRLSSEIGLPAPLASNFTAQFKALPWRSFKLAARFADCSALFIDGAECSHGKGLCFVGKNATSLAMNVSEYLPQCPSLLTLQPGDCQNYPKPTVCCAKPYNALKYGANLVKNEFNDIVVAIHQIHYLDVTLIADLVNVLTNASAALYRATGGRAYFRTVTILSQWNGTHGNATYEMYKYADFKVVPEYNAPQPRALQFGSCLEKGDGVYLGHQHLRQQGSAQMLAKLFALDRWGIGDEVASTPKEFSHVPDDQAAGGASFTSQSSCSANIRVNYQSMAGDSPQFNATAIEVAPNRRSVASFAFRPDLLPEDNAEFCATTTTPRCDEARRHNGEANTPHNRICNRTSTLSAILQSADFDQSQNGPRHVGNTAPTFRFVQYPAQTDLVLAIVADFSGSMGAKTAAFMVNALINLLHIVPDEVKVVLVAVSHGPRVDIMDEPLAPCGPFLQPTGCLHAQRQELIERVKGWMEYVDSAIGFKNTSILRGINQLVQHYLPRTHLRLKILVISDFYATAPSDNRLLVRIRQAGYSFWPISTWSLGRLRRTQIASQFPLINYIQLLANSTYGRWQFIADVNSMSHWFMAMGAFLDDLNLGMSLMIETYQASIGQVLEIPFTVPSKYSLNTSIIIHYNSNLSPATVGGSSNLFAANCRNDDRGYQLQYRVACRLGDLTTTGRNVLRLTFGRESQRAGFFEVVAWIVVRALEYGSQDAGTTDTFIDRQPWLDPWKYRLTTAPDQYVKADAKVTSGVRVVFERSSKFRFPKLYVILSQGRAAVLNCYIEYDLYAMVLNFRDNTDRFVYLVQKGRLFDDGLGEDGFEQDGVYTALLPQVRQNGTFTVHVRVKQSPVANALGCFIKPQSAFVGQANNIDLIARQTPILVPSFSFAKAAGSFEVIVPPDAADVMFLGLVTLKNCDVRNVLPTVETPPRSGALPQQMTLFCDVFPLATSKRYDMTVTYYLSVSRRVADFTEKTRYAANASLTIANSIRFTQETLTLAFNITPVLSPYYYAVVWAADNKENYATRSEVRLIQTPLSDVTTSRNRLPSVTEVTTPYRPDDIMPDVIIFSGIFGAFFAVGLIITVIVVLRRRRANNRKMWAQDASRIYLPSNWPAATSYPPNYQRPPAPIITSSSSTTDLEMSSLPTSQMTSSMTHKEKIDYYFERSPAASKKRRHQQQQLPQQRRHHRSNLVKDQEIFFSQPREHHYYRQSSSAYDDGDEQFEQYLQQKQQQQQQQQQRRPNTIERQNVTNAQLQRYYTRATDGVDFAQRRF